MQQIEVNLDHEISQWGLTESEKRVILSRLTGEWQLRESYEAFDAVIESLPENMEMKHEMLGKIEQLCSEDTVYFSNMAALSVTELAAKARRPEKIIGLHFLPPVHTTPLVEIVRGLSTTDETFAYARHLVQVLGKTPVEVSEYPGYITTRCIIPLMNEAMNIVMEGVASAEDVDTAMKLGFKFRQGPLTMADHIGLDTVMYWMDSLFRELGDTKYRPCPLLRKKVRAGHLGIKTGEGFFQYKDNFHKVG